MAHRPSNPNDQRMANVIHKKKFPGRVFCNSPGLNLYCLQGGYSFYNNLPWIISSKINRIFYDVFTDLSLIVSLKIWWSDQYGCCQEALKITFGPCKMSIFLGGSHWIEPVTTIFSLVNWGNKTQGIYIFPHNRKLMSFKFYYRHKLVSLSLIKMHCLSELQNAHYCMGVCL